MKTAPHLLRLLNYKNVSLVLARVALIIESVILFRAYVISAGIEHLLLPVIGIILCLLIFFLWGSDKDMTYELVKPLISENRGTTIILSDGAGRSSPVVDSAVAGESSSGSYGEPWQETEYSIDEPRGYICPLEGYDPENAHDKFCCEGNRYAVTDGVSGSFLSAQWASIIAKGFVEQKKGFSDDRKFKDWLYSCREAWGRWAREWVETVASANSYEDWNSKIEDGAQTTLVGCSITYKPNGTFSVDVLAIGDSNFFLFRPLDNDQSRWKFLYAYPCQQSENVGSSPDTLATAQWLNHSEIIPKYRKSFDARVGDYICLATDKMTIWLLRQLEQEASEWMELFKYTRNSQFINDFVNVQRANESLAWDDTTMLLIPLLQPLEERSEHK